MSLQRSPAAHDGLARHDCFCLAALETYQFPKSGELKSSHMLNARHKGSPQTCQFGSTSRKLSLGYFSDTSDRSRKGWQSLKIQLQVGGLRRPNWGCPFSGPFDKNGQTGSGPFKRSSYLDRRYLGLVCYSSNRSKRTRLF